jgi:hypothetical protein
MGKYIEDSVSQIKKAIKDSDTGNAVIRFETASGDPEARRMKILEVHDDYFLGQSRTKSAQPEYFSFTHITNWRFEEYKADEWGG